MLLNYKVYEIKYHYFKKCNKLKRCDKLIPILHILEAPWLTYNTDTCHAIFKLKIINIILYRYPLYVQGLYSPAIFGQTVLPWRSISTQLTGMYMVAIVLYYVHSVTLIGTLCTQPVYTCVYTCCIPVHSSAFPWLGWYSSPCTKWCP